MNRILFSIVILLAACSGATGPTAVTPPAGIDPSLLVVNQSPDSVRAIFASDRSGALIYDTLWVGAGTTVCTRWTQTFDSLYTRVVDTLPNATGFVSTVTTPWVHFSQYPYYFQRVVVDHGAGMRSTADSTEC